MWVGNGKSEILPKHDRYCSGASHPRLIATPPDHKVLNSRKDSFPSATLSLLATSDMFNIKCFSLCHLRHSVSTTEGLHLLDFLLAVFTLQNVYTRHPQQVSLLKEYQCLSNTISQYEARDDNCMLHFRQLYPSVLDVTVKRIKGTRTIDQNDTFKAVTPPLPNSPYSKKVLGVNELISPYD